MRSGEYAFNPGGDQPPRLAGVTSIIVEMHLRGQLVSYSASVSMGDISLLYRCLCGHNVDPMSSALVPSRS